VVVVLEASVVAGAVVAPSAGAAVVAAAVVSVVAAAVESVVADSTVLVSVAVVVSSAFFDSQEARVAANTTARADTFRRFFIFGSRFGKFSPKNALYTVDDEW
jgi:hypothetical protein